MFCVYITFGITHTKYRPLIYLEVLKCDHHRYMKILLTVKRLSVLGTFLTRANNWNNIMFTPFELAPFDTLQTF